MNFRIKKNFFNGKLYLNEFPAIIFLLIVFTVPFLIIRVINDFHAHNPNINYPILLLIKLSVKRKTVSMPIIFSFSSGNITAKVSI